MEIDVSHFYTLKTVGVQINDNYELLLSDASPDGKCALYSASSETAKSIEVIGTICRETARFVSDSCSLILSSLSGRFNVTSY
jgi:hypothetical protein